MARVITLACGQLRGYFVDLDKLSLIVRCVIVHDSLLLEEVPVEILANSNLN